MASVDPPLIFGRAEALLAADFIDTVTLGGYQDVRPRGDRAQQLSVTMWAGQDLVVAACTDGVMRTDFSFLVARRHRVDHPSDVGRRPIRPPFTGHPVVRSDLACLPYGDFK